MLQSTNEPASTRQKKITYESELIRSFVKYEDSLKNKKEGRSCKKINFQRIRRSEALNRCMGERGLCE